MKSDSIDSSEVIKMITHITGAVSTVIDNQGTPTGEYIAEIAQNAFARALDITVAATGEPPTDAFDVLSKWGICLPTDKNGVDGTIAGVIGGNHHPNPCVVIHKHGDYDLVHCRGGSSNGIFCLIDATTGESIAKDIMSKLVADLIEDLPSTSAY